MSRTAFFFAYSILCVVAYLLLSYWSLFIYFLFFFARDVKKSGRTPIFEVVGRGLINCGNFASGGPG